MTSILCEIVKPKCVNYSHHWIIRLLWKWYRALLSLWLTCYLLQPHCVICLCLSPTADGYSQSHTTHQMIPTSAFIMNSPNRFVSCFWKPVVDCWQWLMSDISETLCDVDQASISGVYHHHSCYATVLFTCFHNKKTLVVTSSLLAFK